MLADHLHETMGLELSIEKTRVTDLAEGFEYVALLVVGLAGSGAALALQGMGWLVLLRRYFWAAIFAFLAVLYFLLVNGPVGGPKYRLPFEPILIVLQAVALFELFEWWKRRRNLRQLPLERAIPSD